MSTAIHHPDRRALDTEMFISRLISMIDTACWFQGLSVEQEAPLSIRELIKWIRKRYGSDLVFGDWAYKDLSRYYLCDSWWNELVILSKDQKAIGIGSSGPNGKWEEGKGDDIVVLFPRPTPLPVQK